MRSQIRLRASHPRHYDEGNSQYLGSGSVGSTTVDQGQFEFEPDWPLVDSVTRVKYRPARILCRPGLNFDGAARLLQYPTKHRPYLPTLLAEFRFRIWFWIHFLQGGSWIRIRAHELNGVWCNNNAFSGENIKITIFATVHFQGENIKIIHVVNLRLTNSFQLR